MMKSTNRWVAAGIGIAAIGAAVAVPSFASADPVTDALPCTYTVDQESGSVSGECAGETPLGEVSGTFTGTVDPEGAGSGTFLFSSPLGDGEGVFNAEFGTDGGTADGTVDATGPAGELSLPFVASPK